MDSECSFLIRTDTECLLRSLGARSQFIYARVAGEASLTSDETLIEEASSQDSRIAKALQSDALRSNCNHLLISSSQLRRPSAHHGAAVANTSPVADTSAHHGAAVANTNAAGARRIHVPAAFVSVVRDDQASQPVHGPFSLKSPARVAVRCMKAHLAAPAPTPAPAQAPTQAPTQAPAPPGPTGAIVGARAASRGSATARMQQLRQLLHAGLISQEEFDRKRVHIFIPADPRSSGARHGAVLGSSDSRESSEDMSAMRV